MRKILFGFILFLLIFPSVAYSRIGVGIGTGKIQVDEKLKSGMIYKLPPLTVLNTGDEALDYGVSIAYHEKQPQLMPDKKWFSFSPNKFYLKPGETKTVDIKLNLPISTKPGDYFAYLEGYPIKKTEVGQTSVGVAAAAKLYFTVVPTNAVLGVYYKAITFWQVNSPWTERFIILIGAIVLMVILKRFLNIEVNLKKSGDKKAGKEPNIESEVSSYVHLSKSRRQRVSERDNNE